MRERREQRRQGFPSGGGFQWGHPRYPSNPARRRNRRGMMPTVTQSLSAQSQVQGGEPWRIFWAGAPPFSLEEKMGVRTPIRSRDLCSGRKRSFQMTAKRGTLMMQIWWKRFHLSVCSRPLRSHLPSRGGFQWGIRVILLTPPAGGTGGG